MSNFQRGECRSPRSDHSHYEDELSSSRSSSLNLRQPVRIVGAIDGVTLRQVLEHLR